MHEIRKSGAGADEHGLVAHIEQLVYRKGLSYDHVGIYRNPELI